MDETSLRVVEGTLAKGNAALGKRDFVGALQMFEIAEERVAGQVGGGDPLVARIAALKADAHVGMKKLSHAEALYLDALVIYRGLPSGIGQRPSGRRDAQAILKFLRSNAGIGGGSDATAPSMSPRAVRTGSIAATPPSSRPVSARRMKSNASMVSSQTPPAAGAAAVRSPRSQGSIFSAVNSIPEEHEKECMATYDSLGYCAYRAALAESPLTTRRYKTLRTSLAWYALMVAEANEALTIAEAYQSQGGVFMKMGYWADAERAFTSALRNADMLIANGGTIDTDSPIHPSKLKESAAAAAKRLEAYKASVSARAITCCFRQWRVRASRGRSAQVLQRLGRGYFGRKGAALAAPCSTPAVQKITTPENAPMDAFRMPPDMVTVAYMEQVLADRDAQETRRAELAKRKEQALLAEVEELKAALWRERRDKEAQKAALAQHQDEAKEEEERAAREMENLRRDAADEVEAHATVAHEREVALVTELEEARATLFRERTHAASMRRASRDSVDHAEALRATETTRLAQQLRDATDDLEAVETVAKEREEALVTELEETQAALFRERTQAMSVRRASKGSSSDASAAAEELRELAATTLALEQQLRDAQDDLEAVETVAKEREEALAAELEESQAALFRERTQAMSVRRASKESQDDSEEQRAIETARIKAQLRDATDELEACQAVAKEREEALVAELEEARAALFRERTQAMSMRRASKQDSSDALAVSHEEQRAKLAQQLRDAEDDLEALEAVRKEREEALVAELEEVRAALFRERTQAATSMRRQRVADDEARAPAAAHTRDIECRLQSAEDDLEAYAAVMKQREDALLSELDDTRAELFRQRTHAASMRRASRDSVDRAEALRATETTRLAQQLRDATDDLEAVETVAKEREEALVTELEETQAALFRERTQAMSMRRASKGSSSDASAAAEELRELAATTSALEQQLRDARDDLEAVETVAKEREEALAAELEEVRAKLQETSQPTASRTNDVSPVASIRAGGEAATACGTAEATSRLQLELDESRLRMEHWAAHSVEIASARARGVAAAAARVPPPTGDPVATDATASARLRMELWVDGTAGTHPLIGAARDALTTAADDAAACRTAEATARLRVELAECDDREVLWMRGCRLRERAAWVAAAAGGGGGAGSASASTRMAQMLAGQLLDERDHAATQLHRAEAAARQYREQARELEEYKKRVTLQERFRHKQALRASQMKAPRAPADAADAGGQRDPAVPPPRRQWKVYASRQASFHIASAAEVKVDASRRGGRRGKRASVRSGS